MFRDKKSLSMMLIIPIFIPLIMLGMSALFESQSEKDIEEYNKIGFTYELTDTEKDLAQKMDIEIVEDDEKELKEKYKSGEINLYITKDENIYTLNVNLLFRGTMQKATELYEEQFGEELSQDSKLELTKIKKKISKLSKEDIKNLIEDLQKML